MKERERERQLEAMEDPIWPNSNSLIIIIAITTSEVPIMCKFVDDEYMWHMRVYIYI